MSNIHCISQTIGWVPYPEKPEHTNSPTQAEFQPLPHLPLRKIHFVYWKRLTGLMGIELMSSNSNPLLSFGLNLFCDDYLTIPAIPAHHWINILIPWKQVTIIKMLSSGGYCLFVHYTGCWQVTHLEIIQKNRQSKTMCIDQKMMKTVSLYKQNIQKNIKNKLLKKCLVNLSWIKQDFQKKISCFQTRSWQLQGEGGQSALSWMHTALWGL